MDRTEFFAARGFGNTIGFGRAPALIVIDLIAAFTDEALPLGSDLTAQINMTNVLLDAFHSFGAPVFFTTVRYDEPDLKDAGIWPLKQKALATLSAISGGAELDPRLDKGLQDQIIVKKYASSFFGTDLLSRLVSERVDTLVITGCTTSGCVRATAVDALQNGFRPMVVREAVGDRDQSAHDQALFDLTAKYADIVGVVDVLGALAELS